MNQMDTFMTVQRKKLQPDSRTQPNFIANGVSPDDKINSTKCLCTIYLEKPNSASFH